MVNSFNDLSLWAYEKFEDTKGVIRSRNLNTIQRPKEKVQTKTYETLHGKLKMEQHEPLLKPGVNSGAPEG